MLASWQILCIYSSLIVGASYFGGVATSAIRISHTWLQVLVSFVGGLMLGVGILHQWPHSVALLMNIDPASALNWSAGWVMAGLLSMFYLLRTFHFHHHEPFHEGGTRALPAVHHHDHDHSHDHGHHDHDHGSHAPPGVHGVSWAGVTFGLCLHTILDGVALASNVQADSVNGHGQIPGLGTFFGVFLHKPLDSLSITSLMLAGGWSARSRNIVNLSYALMCPLGAALFMVGLKAFSGQEALIASAALAFSAGVFVSIALSDLLPEVQFHSHDRIKLSAALLLGVVAAWGIGFAEPKHAHGHAAPIQLNSQHR